MTDPFLHDDGAYVLGTLPPAERAAFEEHLLTCADCAARVREISGLPALLGQLTEADLLGLGAEDPVPDTLLPRLLKAADARRSRVRVLVGGLAATAAACAAALVVILWPSSGSHPQPATQAMHAVVAGVPVHATVQLVSRSWGTDVVMHCSYASEGNAGEVRVPYVLVVYSRGGTQQRIGSWTLGPGETETFHSPTSLPSGQIDKLVLERSGDRPVLELDL